MPVKQRGASWQAAVSYKGTRLRKDFKTKEEAEDWSATTLAALRSGRVTPKLAPKVPTLGEHLEQVCDVPAALGKEAVMRDRWGYVMLVIFIVIVSYATITVGIDEVALRP